MHCSISKFKIDICDDGKLIAMTNVHSLNFWFDSLLYSLLYSLFSCLSVMQSLGFNWAERSKIILNAVEFNDLRSYLVIIIINNRCDHRNDCCIDSILFWITIGSVNTFNSWTLECRADFFFCEYCSRFDFG